jgi:hypothetical protein
MFRLGDIITIMKTVTLGGGNASAEPNTQPNAWVHLYTNPGPNSIAIEAYEIGDSVPKKIQKRYP